jgi:putative ABC transport system permease protein
MDYLKIAWRGLKKQPFFTFLNIFGLAIGMAGFLLISLFIYDELTFDKMFSDSDRIYRIDIELKNAGEINKYAAIAPLLAPTLANDYPQIEMVTRFKLTSSKLLRKTNTELNVKEDHVVGVDSTFFKMFGLDLLIGNTKTALTAPNTLILTKTAAEKHFLINEALGQTLLLDNKDIYTVTGVIDDMPKNSFLRNHTVFIAMASYDDADDPSWANWTFPSFIKLLPSANINSLETRLSSVFETYMIPWIRTFSPGYNIEDVRKSRKKTGNYMKWSSVALTDIHLYSIDIEDELSPNSDIQNVHILSFIGLFLVLLACVNFMNLSTAHSLKRAKEVGIRKTLGSHRIGLIWQFLTEAGLISFLSLLVAIILAIIVMPFFNELANKAIVIPFGNPIFWILLFSITALLGLFSGSYPAFFMSNFAPARVLKGGGQNSIDGGNIRNFLVVFQFAISVFLIVYTLVVFQQLQFIQNKDLSYQKDQVLIIDDVDAVRNQKATFKQEVQQLAQVARVSLSSFLPTPSARSSITFFRKGDQENGLIFGNWKVDYDYISTLNMEILSGRDFDNQISTDSSAIILNESAVAMLGVKPEEALGRRLTNDFKLKLKDDEKINYYTVIGVVKNFHFESFRNNIDATSLSLGSNSNKMIVKLESGNFSNSIASIEKIWKNRAPGQPFNYYFMDDSFNTTYESEQRLGNIFITFTILSIFIACVGLFGLAAFNAERRYKEIGMRKVLGASVFQITYKLSVDFLKLVGIAILISLPLAWYVMDKWLQDFSYRIEIGWGVFVLAAFLAIIISILTVSFQSIKAALANPIKSLKTE